DTGDYLKSVWTEIGMPDGPVTWEDLVKAGPLIKGKHPEIQIPIGVGMSQELDTNMATRAMLWSFDGSIQDANENVVLKSDQALAALEFGVRLFKAGMNPAVLSWNAAKQPGAQRQADGLHPQLHLSVSHRAGQQAPGGGRHLLRPGAQGPAGNAVGKRARDGDLRDLEVRPEPGCREAVSPRPHRPLPRRRPGQQALQFPIVPGLRGRGGRP